MSALVYLNNKNDVNYINSQHVVKEYFACGGLLLVTILGSYPNGFLPFPWYINLTWWCISRSIYGLSLAYLMLLMVISNQQDLPWYRPVRYLRYILSAKLWIPIAMVSYSLYIWHLVPQIFLGGIFWNLMINNYYT